MDKSAIWCGSVSVLVHTAEEDGVIKIVDDKLANEPLNVIYNGNR